MRARSVSLKLSEISTQTTVNVKKFWDLNYYTRAMYFDGLCYEPKHNLTSLI